MPVAKEQIRQIISQNNISSVADVYTLLKDSFKDILQELMEAELDATLGYEKNKKGDLVTDNKRNGHSPKTLKSQYGEFQVDVPRDRNGNFEPKLIPKYQRDISGIEEKVISLYARGMSTRDIHDQLQDLYGIAMSAEMVSKITDKILPEVKEWQARPLNPVYPFVFMDCIHYKVREDGRILSRAAYIVLGVTVDMDILGTHASGIKRKDFFFDSRHIPLIFRYQFRLKFPITVPGNIELELPILTLNCFWRMSITFVVRGKITLLIFFITKSYIHFCFH